MMKLYNNIVKFDVYTNLWHSSLDGAAGWGFVFRSFVRCRRRRSQKMLCVMTAS